MILLVVEDNPDIADVVTAVCAPRGIVVLPVVSYRDACVALAGGEVDAVLTDGWFHHHDAEGYGLYGPAVAKVAVARGLPVVLMSGEPINVAAVPGLAQVPFLAKPFSMVELVATLRWLAERVKVPV